MSRRLLVLGSITAVGATASLLIFNQNSLRSPISITPTLPNTSAAQSSSNKKGNVLIPLLPSLTKPLTSSDELSRKEPLAELRLSSQPIATPTITLSVKPKQFVSSSLSKSSLEKPPNMINPVSSQQLVSRGEAELSPKKSAPVFTHRSRPIVAPMDYPVVPIESLATPTPVLETPTPNTPRELFVTPVPIPETPTPKAPLVTQTPIQPLAIPSTPIELLATPRPTNLLATPTLTPSPN
jgi:hypothetical protein